ncbi:MAG: hypothetical protein IT341_00510 [Chloroflexi bacterium]|nr:hypothetical protein [Chloroflexota bacterium]
MPPAVWLITSIVAAGGAYAVAWPAWQSLRARRDRDTNTDRYLRWRGRAPRDAPSPAGPTGDERRRLAIGAVLAGVAAVALIAFLAGG